MSGLGLVPRDKGQRLHPGQLPEEVLLLTSLGSGLPWHPHSAGAPEDSPTLQLAQRCEPLG